MTNIRNEGSRNGLNNWISEPFFAVFSRENAAEIRGDNQEFWKWKGEGRNYRRERERGRGQFAAVSRLFPRVVWRDEDFDILRRALQMGNIKGIRGSWTESKKRGWGGGNESRIHIDEIPFPVPYS